MLWQSLHVHWKGSFEPHSHSSFGYEEKDPKLVLGDQKLSLDQVFLYTFQLQ